jgi:hypothetical protein
MALTKLNNKAVANVTSIPVALGDMVLVSSATASSSASIEFLLGSYKEYKFFFVNMHPATNNVEFEFNMSTDSGSSYNVTKTTTVIDVYHAESDAFSGLDYGTDDDLAESTGFQTITKNISNDNDGSFSGTLTLFNPSSTTYVKHFISNTNKMETGVTANFIVAGYGNTTSAVNAIQFKMNSGNIDAGKILMFGIN